MAGQPVSAAEPSWESLRHQALLGALSPLPFTDGHQPLCGGHELGPPKSSMPQRTNICGKTPQRGARPWPGGAQGGKSLILANAIWEHTAARQAPRVTRPGVPRPQAPACEQQPGGLAADTGFRNQRFFPFSVRITLSRALHWRGSRGYVHPRAGSGFLEAVLKLLLLGAMGCVYTDYSREWVSQAPCAPWSRACPRPRHQ